MKFTSLLTSLVVTFLALASSASGEAPKTTPATAPSPTVLIIPFQQITTADSTGHSWVAQALQEDMIATVAQFAVAQPKTSAKPLPNADLHAAVEAGRENNASAVIFGSYQVLNDQIRVDGTIANVSNSQILGSLQATGTTQDLFKMEDALAAQIRGTLQRPVDGALPIVSYGASQNGSNPYYIWNNGQNSGASADSGLPYINTTQADSGLRDYSYNYAAGSSPAYVPPSYNQSPDYSYYTTPYPYSYPYVYSNYGYPYAYGPSFFIGGFGFESGRNFRFDHDGDGRGRFDGDFRGGFRRSGEGLGNRSGGFGGNNVSRRGSGGVVGFASSPRLGGAGASGMSGRAFGGRGSSGEGRSFGGRSGGGAFGGQAFGGSGGHGGH